MLLLVFSMTKFTGHKSKLMGGSFQTNQYKYFFNTLDKEPIKSLTRECCKCGSFNGQGQTRYEEWEENSLRVMGYTQNMEKSLT